MAWVRIHDGALTHPKLVGLSDKAFRLWVWGLCYCQMHLTDGVIPAAAVPFPTKTAVVLTLAHLWDARDEGGFVVHDYLDWNDSREYVTAIRQLAKARMVLVKDPAMRQELRVRDQDLCRYCRLEVKWADRKSRAGATYDHVIPGGGDTLENIVIACRGCNSKKQRRTPEQAGMSLLPPPPQESKSTSRLISAQSPLISSGLGSVRSSGSEKRFGEKPHDSLLDRAITERAGTLLERYDALYSEHRRGARHRARPSLDWQEACDLCRIWPSDARLEKLAVIFLTTDDPWISSTDRSFMLFAKKVTWCDDRLTVWEAQHGVAS